MWETASERTNGSPDQRYRVHQDGPEVGCVVANRFGRSIAGLAGTTPSPSRDGGCSTRPEGGSVRRLRNSGAEVHHHKAPPSSQKLKRPSLPRLWRLVGRLRLETPVGGDPMGPMIDRGLFRI